MKGNYLFLDFETSGLNNITNGILEYGFMVYDNDEKKIVMEDSGLVNPGNAIIDDKAIEVNNINVSQAKAKGITYNVLKEKINRIIAKYNIKAFIGWNVMFDLGFMRQLYSNIEYRDMSKVIKKIDLRTLAYLCVDLDYYSLENTANLFGVEYNKHIAIEDVGCTVRLYEELMKFKERI